MNKSIPTPCIQVCKINTQSGLCIGCHRTRNEVARWGAMTNPERLRIMSELPKREQSIGRIHTSKQVAG